MSATPTKNPLPGLLTAQFLGAFNDNAFKMIVALFGIAAVGDAGEERKQAVTTFAFVVFTLPLMLGSLPAMAFGDRVGKRTLLVATKALEVVLMALGTVALWLQPAGWMPLVVLGGMGLQSAFFAPAKYGILPETLPHERLAAANGKLEAASFLAIILGTAGGGPMKAMAGDAPWIAGLMLLALAVAGLVAAMLVPYVPPSAAAGERASATFGGAWRALRGDRVLWLATVGSTLFWGLASLLGQDVFVYCKHVLGLSDDVAGAPLAMFAIGVGAGAMLAGQLARGRIESGFIPLGALGLAAATLVFGLVEPGRVGTFALMVLLGVPSGFVVVPLNALVQWRAPADRRGAIIALYNAISFAGVLVGNLGCLWLADHGSSSTDILVVAAVLTAAATAWAVWLMPVALLRAIAMTVTHSLYRVTVTGGRNIPERGGALLVPNHVSFLDGLFLQAATDRSIRFVVDQSWYEKPLLRRFFRAIGAIPVAAAGGPRVVLRALRDAGKALDAGEVVCLFAEGEVSRMGSTLPFRRGLQRIVKGRPAPIVPVHLDRVYGSWLSSQSGKVRLWPTRVPCPVTVSVGEPLPPTAEPATVRQCVEELGGEAFRLRAAHAEPLHRSVLRRARHRPWRHALADSQGKKLSRLQANAAAVVLARRLRPALEPGEALGVLLPPSIGAGLCALAASMAGRAVVPLNYTIGEAAIASMVRQAKLRVVVTSRAFRDRVKVPLPGDVRELALEDLLAGITRGERLGAALRVLLLPPALLERACGATKRGRGGDTAAILFSSGSTGEPKGVVLSHANVLANAEAVAQVLPLSARDKLLGVLPMFHSFGNFAFWCAMDQGAAMVFHPNPLDAAAVGEITALHRVTMLIATPTFLQLYLRRCEPGQLGSVRLVLTGAEKLTDQLAAAFADKFGILPVQGYGCTETSPVVAVSTPGYRAAGFYQAGTRRGSVGRPLPGVVVTIVDPDTMVPVPVGRPGLVLVRGANVMQGYLGRDDLTAAAMRDGAYVTGDIGRLDEDGFLFLTDRLSRFSKIGGEMVPHGTVEEHLQQCAGREDRVFAVCGVPDDRKGERLAVLTTLSAEAIPDVLAKMAGRGLPPLFVPRRDQFVFADALPLLGTGKLDLRAVKERCLATSGD
ncbi:MAG: MFS transporter [Planctomycetota bacterium]